MKHPTMGSTAIALLMAAAFLCQPVNVEGASVVYTEKDFYDQNEMIGVYFTNAPGNASDWICIVPAGSPDNEAGYYQYLPQGLSEGILFFDPPVPGTYEVRAYYNYRQRGYAVSGRHAFLVTGDTAVTDVPPPIVFAEEPNIVELPGTEVYVVPGVAADIYFQGGWWWRPWGGTWYRSRYYDSGWVHYRGIPSWHLRIPGNWRTYYPSLVPGGRPGLAVPPPIRPPAMRPPGGPPFHVRPPSGKPQPGPSLGKPSGARPGSERPQALKGALIP